jgi:hypothetical protein
MSALLLLAQVTVQTLAPGIPQAVPPTAWNCSFQAADGSRKFVVAGTTPLFPAGWDPNSAKYVRVISDHPDAFSRPVGIDPGHASEWFREFQVSSSGANEARFVLSLLLRREGHSIGYITRYVSTGRQVPYEYYAVGLCRADFAPTAGSQERG